MGRQSVWYSVFRRDCLAHRLDIAACDRLPDPEMALDKFIRSFGGSLDIITVEDGLELSGGHPGAPIGDGQMGKAVVTGQVHQDLAPLRGEKTRAPPLITRASARQCRQRGAARGTPSNAPLRLAVSIQRD